MEVLIIFDTRYGNTYKLAEAVAEGVQDIEGVNASLRRVEITEPEDVIQKHEAWRTANEKFKAIPQVTLEEMAEADALIFGSPTRFGNMSAPLKKLWDSTGRLWVEGKLFGKVGAAFTSSGTPGANEMILITMFIPMYHHGMIVVTPGYGDPAVFEAGSPYGASSVSGPLSDRLPTENDLKVARYLGKRVAQVAHKLASSMD